MTTLLNNLMAAHDELANLLDPHAIDVAWCIYSEACRINGQDPGDPVHLTDHRKAEPWSPEWCRTKANLIYKAFKMAGIEK